MEYLKLLRDEFEKFGTERDLIHHVGEGSCILQLFIGAYLNVLPGKFCYILRNEIW
jgi:hypothetical protein